jgi:hypothetical protein
MTGYTVHTGSTEQFAEGWNRIFGGQSDTQKTPAKKTAASTNAPKKKPAKNRAARKQS